MLKKLEMEALQADLDTVSAILDGQNEYENPVGYRQFRKRKAKIESQLAEVEAHEPQTASIGLFFGGRPVIGSRGIVADFGAKAVEQFQAVVASRVAAEAGAQGARGPIRHRDRSQLLITDVVRGSFGFVLEEAENDAQGGDLLQTTMNEVVEVIRSASADDRRTFEASIEALDDRTLYSLKGFFKHLDDSGATMRMVDNEREFALTRDDVERGRRRTEALTISESFHDYAGILYILPDSKRFELIDQRTDTVRRGTITRDCFAAITTQTGQIRAGIVGSLRTVRLRVREVQSRNRPTQYGYTLVEVREID